MPRTITHHQTAILSREREKPLINVVAYLQFQSQEQDKEKLRFRLRVTVSTDNRPPLYIDFYCLFVFISQPRLASRE